MNNPVSITPRDCKCNICGATYIATSVPDFSRWAGNHGCMDRVIKQRDRLLSACKAARYRLERLDDDAAGEHSPAYIEVITAIAKTEGLS